MAAGIWKAADKRHYPSCFRGNKIVMRTYIAFLILSASAAYAHGHDEVRVWQDTLVLPTYEEGAPDPNPPFDAFSAGRFNYPYALRENLTDQRAPHAWRAVYLENEYLKCSVLPDLGGHLYTCVDKISGQPMFYANPSIKKANIGYRGAWAAFGIEFNFPVSHNWVSLSPVGFSFATHADGSASVWVGNIDRVYGMQWLVELQLRPDSTVLEEHVTLNNRSDVRHRFYWWNNAGIEVKDDSRICYPMRFTAGHGFHDVDTWPVDSTGKDLSLIHNQTGGPVSRFVYGSREPFMGVWRPDTNSGVVHYADYAELPAKKIWSWGVDADGLDWRRALSDNGSAYVEVQAGLFRNQETYAFLEPRQTIRFSEYWMPARGIGGIARANLAGVLNLTRRDGGLVAAFNANRKIAPASIRILQGARVLAAETITLEPEHTWKLAIGNAGAAPCTFELRDAAGKVLLRHTEGEYDWAPAAEIHTGPQPHPGEDDWVQRGADRELQGDAPAALRAYQNGLQHDAGSLSLAVAAGRLCASLQRYGEAIRYLEPAAARATWDAEIAYYLGLAYDGAGDYAKARPAYESAARMPAWRAAASLKLGELLARTGDREAALEFLRAAQGDPRAEEEAIALARVLGRAQKAGETACPTCAFARWDAGPREDPALLRFLAADPARVLEIAAAYMRLGLYRPAVDLLSRDFPSVPPDETEPGAVLPQQHPLVSYYRGYCRAKLGESPAPDYAAARKLSTLYVFPNSAEDLEVLRAASQADPDDMTARYLLGTQYFARGLVDDALIEWNTARHAGARIPVLHADLAGIMLREKHDASGALRVFNEGLAVDPLNPKLYDGVDEALTLTGRPARELADALARYPDLPHMPADLVYALALDRAEALDFDGAMALFHGRFFPREENAAGVRQVWVEVKILEAMSQAAAGKCDMALAGIAGLASAVAGLPFTTGGLAPFVDAPRTQYMIGQVEAGCGRASQAAEHWSRVAASTGPADVVWAWGAARKFVGYDQQEWTRRLEAVLAQASAQGGSGAPYAQGILEVVLGKRSAGWAHLQQAMLLPDRMMLHHLSRMAMAGTGLPEYPAAGANKPLGH
jgi:tetratricopeptide (TPR) repeat protein